MANKTSVPTAELKALAKADGITEGMGSRGRVSAATVAKVLGSHPKVLRQIASDLGVTVTGLRGTKRAEAIEAIAKALV